MTTNIEVQRTSRWLQVAAWVQAVAIVGFGALLLQGGEPAPVVAAPTADGRVEAVPPAVVTRLPAPAGTSAAPADPRTAASSPATEGTVLYGCIVDETGAAVESAYIWLRRDGDPKQLATISARRGHSEFAIAGLPSGKLAWSARATGYKEQRGTIDIPAGVARLRHDFVLESSWILAVRIVTPEGEPLHEALSKASKTRKMLWNVEVGAVVTATQPAGDFPPTALRELTFGLGRWRSATGFSGLGREGPKLAKDVAGTVEIDTPQALWVSAVMRNHVLTSAPVEPGQQEVTLTLSLDQVLKDLGSIRGRVVDASSGAPIAGAAVGFGDLQSGGLGGKSDGQGMFEVADLRPGLLTVEIRGDKKQARRDLILLQPGQALDLGDVPVFEFRTVKGRCDGLVGKAEDGRIAYTPLDPTWNPAVRHHGDSTSIAADGSFTLYLVDGRYQLRAYGAGGAVVEIDTRTLGNEPLVLKLAKEASLRLDVQTDGESWELALFDGTGREVYRRDLQDGWKFALPFLPGDYRAELTGPGGKKQTRQIKLGADGADLHVP